MNSVPFILIIVTMPLLLGGCGVEEPVVEVKPEEPVAETKPELEGVNWDELERRGIIWYLKGSDTPYTGKVYGLHENGQKLKEGGYKDGKHEGLWTRWHENGKKESETNYKKGKRDGLLVAWHENGHKWLEENYKDHEVVSIKLWNSKGEPVDSLEEAQK